VLISGKNVGKKEEKAKGAPPVLLTITSLIILSLDAALAGSPVNEANKTCFNDSSVMLSIV